MFGIEFRNFDFKTSLSAFDYEIITQMKSSILIALYLAKNKGDGVKSRQNLLEYFDETTEKRASTNAQLSMKICSFFNPRQLTVLKKTHIASYYAILKEQITEMLGAWHNIDHLLGTTFERDI